MRWGFILLKTFSMVFYTPFCTEREKERERALGREGELNVLQALGISLGIVHKWQGLLLLLNQRQ